MVGNLPCLGGGVSSSDSSEMVTNARSLFLDGDGDDDPCCPISGPSTTAIVSGTLHVPSGSTRIFSTDGLTEARIWVKRVSLVSSQAGRGERQTGQDQRCEVVQKVR